MRQDKDLIDDLTRIFAAMGQTADQVAETLRAHGCRGYHCGNSPCPVFRYVYRKFDDGQLVLQYDIYSQALKPSKLCLYPADGERRVEMPLPAAIAEFLARFDDGLYPDLDLESDRGAA